MLITSVSIAVKAALAKLWLSELSRQIKPLRLPGSGLCMSQRSKSLLSQRQHCVLPLRHRQCEQLPSVWLPRGAVLAQPLRCSVQLCSEPYPRSCFARGEEELAIRVLSYFLGKKRYLLAPLVGSLCTIPVLSVTVARELCRTSMVQCRTDRHAVTRDRVAQEVQLFDLLQTLFILAFQVALN